MGKSLTWSKIIIIDDIQVIQVGMVMVNYKKQLSW